MLAEALRLIRIFHDLKQNELADRLDMSASFISEIEKGRKTPSVDIIEKYAREFKIPASSILFFSEQLEKKGNERRKQGEKRNCRKSGALSPIG